MDIDVTVAKDGSGNFSKVQEAIDHAPNFKLFKACFVSHLASKESPVHCHIETLFRKWALVHPSRVIGPNSIGSQQAVGALGP